MKEGGKEFWEDGRPDKSTEDCIQYCLDIIYVDKDKTASDVVAVGDLPTDPHSPYFPGHQDDIHSNSLTFEELIGALLMGRDSAQRVADLEARTEELENSEEDAKPTSYTYFDEKGNPFYTCAKSEIAKECPKCKSQKLKDKGSWSKCLNCGERICDSVIIPHVPSEED